MTTLILAMCGAAVVHLVAVRQIRRTISDGVPGWFHIAWPAALVVVTVAAIEQSDGPVDSADGHRVLWLLAVDLAVLLAVAVSLTDSPVAATGPEQAASVGPDRRRLLLGILGTGTATAAGMLLGAPEAATQTPSQIDPIARGARPDYTGRLGTPGTGTDSRAGIQAALDAASDVSGSDYFGYVTRRSTTVTLPPGHYLIGAPDRDASLVLPPGVVLDARAATLYVDYPAAARASWCAIRVGQAGQLRLGKLYPSGRTPPPGGGLVYDAVRIVQSDDNSRVVGYEDSVISGWQGAAIRGVGAWLVYVQGLRIADCAYGYVASTTGDGTLGYVATQVVPTAERSHADVRMQDCYFVNLSHGGIVGSVRPTAASLLTPDFESLNLTVGLIGCAFEGVRGYALEITSAMVVSTWDCAFENVGAGGRAMVRLDNCRTASFAGTRVNVSSTRDDVGRPVPRYIFEVGTTQSLVVDGMHVVNDASPALQLADAEPRTSWRVGNVGPPGVLVPGPAYGDNEVFALSGGWDKGHLVIGSHHLWVDGDGALRHKNGPPSSPLDGTVVP